MSNAALQSAVDQAGSQTKLAEAIGASQQLVSYWLSKGKPLPAEYVLEAERKLGISRHSLRPDIYPADQAAA